MFLCAQGDFVWRETYSKTKSQKGKGRCGGKVEIEGS